MKKLLLSLTLVFVATFAFAQDEYKKMVKEELTKMNFEDASAILGFDLDPSSEVGQLFNTFSDAFMENGASKLKLVKKYAENFRKIDGDMAKQLIKEMQNVEKDRLKLMDKMFKKMSKVLPAEDALSLIQYQNKKNSIIDAALTRLVPFANE